MTEIGIGEPRKAITRERRSTRLTFGDIQQKDFAKREVAEDAKMEFHMGYENAN